MLKVYRILLLTLVAVFLASAAGVARGSSADAVPAWFRRHDGPWWSMNLYYQRLQEQGISSARHTDWLAGHEWLEQAPELILDWFRRYP